MAEKNEHSDLFYSYHYYNQHRPDISWYGCHKMGRDYCKLYICFCSFISPKKNEIYVLDSKIILISWGIL